MSGTKIIVLNLDNISLSTLGAVFKHSNESPEGVVRIIGNYLGFPLKTWKAQEMRGKGTFFLIIAKKALVKYSLAFGDGLE